MLTQRPVSYSESDDSYVRASLQLANLIRIVAGQRAQGRAYVVARTSPH